MSPSYEWMAIPPKLPRDGVAEVVEALLPLLIWSDTPVVKVVAQGLSVIERFVLEAALDLGEVTVDEVAEVTGLPADLAARVMARVAAAGVIAVEPDTTSYRPVVPAAAAALEAAELREFHQARLTFVYLPTTDELLAFDTGPGRPGPPLVNRIQPVYEAPLLRADLVGVDRDGFLNERIEAVTVHTLPDWVDAADTDDSRLPETAPAYRCRGHVKHGKGGPTLSLDLVDATKHNKKEPSKLAAATGLAEWFAARAASLHGAVARWGEPPVDPQRLVIDGRACWSLPLSGAGAREAIQAELPLSRDLGITIHDEEATVSVAARLAPADDAASVIFALDHAVGELLAVAVARQSPAVLHRAAGVAEDRYGQRPTEIEIMHELWRRRKFVHLYVLRATDDFPYD